MIDATVIIASFDTRTLLLDCLADVARAQEALPSRTLEVVVVDNGSSDGSAAAVRAAFPDVLLLAGVRNRGFAAAMNRGLRAAKGRTAILLNSDVSVDAALIDGGLRRLDQHPDIGVLGPRLLHVDGRPQRSVHRPPSWRTEFLPLDWIDRITERLGRRDAHESSAAGLPSQEIDVDAVRGAVLFLRTSMLEKVGDLNESFFFFLEETEYCARARRAGFRVVWAPALTAIHQLGASSKRRAPAATRIEYHRSLYRFLEAERGRSLAIAARVNRALRTSVGLLGTLPTLPFSTRARGRFSQRTALLLWHLRGCPDQPGLAEMLDRDAASFEASGVSSQRGGSRQR